MGSSFVVGALLVASLAASASAAFPWCTCSDYAIGSSPYSLSLFSTTTSATNITATFVVNALDTPARPSTCFNILQDNGVEKIELASSISCLRNVRVLINGLPSLASGIDMPANFRTKANVKAKFVPALTSNSADGTLITVIGLGPCSTWSTLFGGVAPGVFSYSVFNWATPTRCCPTGTVTPPSPSPPSPSPPSPPPPSPPPPSPPPSPPPPKPPPPSPPPPSPPPPSPPPSPPPPSPPPPSPPPPSPPPPSPPPSPPPPSPPPPSPPPPSPPPPSPPPSPPPPSPPPPSPPPPSPPPPSPPPPSPPPPSPPPPSPPPPSPSPPLPPPPIQFASPPPPVRTNFPFCECRRSQFDTPYRFDILDISNTSTTQVITAMFSVVGCDITSPCCGMDLRKIEFHIGDVCRPSLMAATVAGAPISWSWQSFGPGRQVMKLVNLFYDFDTADGVEVTITLNRSGLCPTWNTFFRGAYAIFNSDMKCCPRGDLAQP